MDNPVHPCRRPPSGAVGTVVAMSASAEYCELCDLPMATCVHGRPPPTPTPVTRPEPRARAVTRRAAPRTVPGTPPKRVQRRWTPPDALKPVILAVLQDAGGELDAEDLFLELETVVEHRLLEGDRDTTPEGELRWQYAARRARQALVGDGLMATGRPGVWELTEAGRRTTAG